MVWSKQARAASALARKGKGKFIKRRIKIKAARQEQWTATGTRNTSNLKRDRIVRANRQKFRSGIGSQKGVARRAQKRKKR